jgi:hypothetical protein
MSYIVARLFEVDVGLVLLPDASYQVSTLAITNVQMRKEKVTTVKLTQIPWRFKRCLSMFTVPSEAKL